jgi:hypothetical protein
MTVYLLEHGYYYEGNDTLGIYVSEELALKYAIKYMAENKDYADREWEEVGALTWTVGGQWLKIYTLEVIEK